jgi:predicted phage tail protein
MKKLILTGRLGKEFGREFEYDASTPAELIRAYCYQVPGFEKALMQGEYRVVRMSPSTPHDIGENALHLQFGRATGIKLVPVVKGAKGGGKKGLGKIILGVVLVAAVFMTAGAAGAFASGGAGMSSTLATTGLLSHVTYGFLASQAAMMVLGGVAQMLTPTVKDGQPSDQKESYLMDATGNLTEQGNPVPIVFGEVYTGSVVISTGVEIEELPIP